LQPNPRVRKSSSARKPKLVAKVDSSSSSSQDGVHVRTTKPKHTPKPPNYDGASSFETFLAQFQNCSVYNQWTQSEQLAYLRGLLEKQAGQVLWDYSTESTNSVKKLIRALKERFGGANQGDKFQIEVKNRKMKAGESLQNLHSGIRRLVALAFPNLDHKARELMACDHFIDALDDPNFALKVRERMPKNLDSALRIALQLAVWTKDVDRVRQDLQKDMRTREVAKAEPKKQDLTEALSKRITELEKQFAEVRYSKSNLSSAEGASSSVEREKKNSECWGCGDPNHRIWGCPKLSTEKTTGPKVNSAYHGP